MTKPKEKAPTPDEVIGELLLGASRIQALYVACHLGIPDLLAAGPRSSTLLASTTGVHPDALHRLLRFLAAEGYFELNEDGRFALTPLSERLRSDAPGGMRGVVLSTATRGWEVWGHLLYSVETGQPAFERVVGQTYFAEQQANAESLSRFDAAFAVGAAESGRALASILSPVDVVADLGCGSGALLAQMLLAWPNARGIAVDAEGPLALAAPRFESAGLAERITVYPGDFFKGVPAGAALYVLSLVLHDWDDAKCLTILRHCQEAMAPGARLAILENVMPDDPRTVPRAAHADLGMLVMTGGRERTLAEYRSLLERAGLRFDRVSKLPGNRQASAIEATRGLF